MDKAAIRNKQEDLRDDLVLARADLAAWQDVLAEETQWSHFLHEERIKLYELEIRKRQDHLAALRDKQRAELQAQIDAFFQPWYNHVLAFFSRDYRFAVMTQVQRLASQKTNPPWTEEEKALRRHIEKKQHELQSLRQHPARKTPMLQRAEKQIALLTRKIERITHTLERLDHELYDQN